MKYTKEKITKDKFNKRQKRTKDKILIVITKEKINLRTKEKVLQKIKFKGKFKFIFNK